MSNENLSFQIKLLNLFGFLGIALFIYTMIVYNETRTKDLENLDTNYIDMINWINSFAIAEIVVTCSIFLVTIIYLIIGIMCDDFIILASIMNILMIVTGYIIQIIYVSLAIPIKYTMDIECSNIHYNNTEICDFYQDKFNPILIILIVLLSISSISYCLVGCFACVGGCFQTYD
jgi:hypothetical protein